MPRCACYNLDMVKAKKRTHHQLPVLIEQDEDGVFIVTVPTLRGCSSYGYTIEEAMENIAEAAALCLEDEEPLPPTRFIGVRAMEITV